MIERVPTYTADQVRDAERPLLEAHVPLMQRAAAALAAIAREELMGAPGARHFAPLEPVVRERADAPRPRVLVLVGSGDNGGDALYAASRLAPVADVDVLLVSERFHEAGFAAAVGAGVRWIELPEAADAGADYALVIDGILGIGASGRSALRGRAREAVTALLPLAGRGGMPRVVAVDIPSGLDPDSGAADDAVLPASVTVTFGAVKSGLAAGRGPQLAGDVVLVDIGLGLEGVQPVGEASVSRVVTAPQG